VRREGRANKEARIRRANNFAFSDSKFFRLVQPSRESEPESPNGVVRAKARTRTHRLELKVNYHRVPQMDSAVWVLAFARTTRGSSVLSPPQRRLDESLRILTEFAHRPEMIRLLQPHRLQAVFRQPQQLRIGIGHQHGRMGRHDHLAVADIIHPPHQLQELDLARRRQSRFRLVEDEDALALAALVEEAQKAFAVGMREEIRRWSSEGIVRAALSRYRATEKKLSARKNQPLVIFGSQLARNAFDNPPPITSMASE